MTQNNTQNECFKQHLNNIPFYQSHQYMIPFVGANYYSPNHRKLLLIAESHYVPKSERRHLDIDKWYEGLTIDDSQELYRWCWTEKTFGDFDSGTPGKRISKEILEIFNCAKPKDEVSYYNYFLRPANCKKSFGQICTDKDLIAAYENFCQVLDCLTPDLVVFVSKYSYDSFTSSRSTMCTKVPIFYVNHPACSWWNRVTRPEYFHNLTSRIFFRKILKDYWVL